jgi:hypothetical protein
MEERIIMFQKEMQKNNIRIRKNIEYDLHLQHQVQQFQCEMRRNQPIIKKNKLHRECVRKIAERNRVVKNRKNVIFSMKL